MGKMKLQLTIGDDAEIRAYARQAIKASVTTVVRDELKEIVQNTINDEVVKLFRKIETEVVKQANNKVDNAIVSTHVEKYVRERLTDALNKLVNNITFSYIHHESDADRMLKRQEEEK